MQIEITGFSVPPRGLFSSLRAVSLRAATTSRRPETDGEQDLMEIGTGAKGRTCTTMN